jgi:hypothetical protein
VEHKARSFLAALYSNADIDLLSLPAGEISEPKRCTYSLATAEKGLWRRFGAGILLPLSLNRISWEVGLWIVAIFPATCLIKMDIGFWWHDQGQGAFGSDGRRTSVAQRRPLALSS